MNKDITKLEVKLPLFTPNETIALDNYLDEIIKRINKTYIHDKDLALAQEIIKRLQQKIDKATNYYYKTLAEYEKENKQMPEESVMMFNLLEGNR